MRQFRGFRSMPGQVTRHGKPYNNVHVVVTEAQSLEDACTIIAAKQRQAKAARNRAEKDKENPPSLRMELARAKSRATMLKRGGKVSLAGSFQQQRDPRLINQKKKGPHPFRDLDPEAKIEKAREMYGSGKWGFGSQALYRLGQHFGVGSGQIAEWCEGISPPL